MKILALDTSGRVGSVCLAEGEKIVAEISLDTEITHTERLLPAIDLLLKQAGWALADLGGLALTIGPGSFTGLRIGLATLKGFAQVYNLPIVGVSSLQVLAHNACDSDKPVAAVMDARRGEVYAAVYQFHKEPDTCCDVGPKASSLIGEQAMPPQKLSLLLKKFVPCLLLGDGAKAYENIFCEALGNGVRFGEAEAMRLHARWVASLALPRLKKGEGKNWHGMVPNYIRKSDAEKR